MKIDRQIDEWIIHPFHDHTYVSSLFDWKRRRTERRAEDRFTPQGKERREKKEIFEKEEQEEREMRFLLYPYVFLTYL